MWGLYDDIPPPSGSGGDVGEGDATERNDDSSVPGTAPALAEPKASPTAATPPVAGRGTMMPRMMQRPTLIPKSQLGTGRGRMTPAQLAVLRRKNAANTYQKATVSTTTTPASSSSSGAKQLGPDVAITSTTASLTSVVRAPQVPSQNQQPRLLVGSRDIEDEYDPARPNEYEEYLQDEEMRKERERLARRRKLEKERERPMHRLAPQLRATLVPPPSSYYDSNNQGSIGDCTTDSSGGSARGDCGGDGRPSLQISGEDAFLRRGQIGRGRGITPPSSAGRGRGRGDGGVSDARSGGGRRGSGADGGRGTDRGRGRGSSDSWAEQQLKKYGWEEGKGLGKAGQGISAPLLHKKTAPNQGVIVEESKPAAPAGRGRGATVPSWLKKRKVQSTVVLLQNMVGPGEVDGDLESETGNECAKYGKVDGCTIIELKGDNVSAEEAVRIFVKFESLPAAEKAFGDLNGRYFGGRQVKASYFDEYRYDRKDFQ